MKMYFKLIGIENNHPVKKSTDCSFLLLIQRAALLGLKDAGQITQMQHRQAEEALLRQYREAIRVNYAQSDGND